MGNSNSIQSYESSQYQNPNTWKPIAKRLNYTLIRNTNTLQELEMYAINTYQFQQPEVQIQKYLSRKNSDDSYSVRCVSYFKQYNSYLCQNTQTVIIITQRINRIQDIFRFDKKQCFHYFKESLKGYRFMLKKYGKFKLTASQIGLTKNRQLKLWINKNFALNKIENPIDYIYNEQIENMTLYKIFCQKVESNSFKKIFSQIQGRFTYQNIMKYLEGKQNKISLNKTMVKLQQKIIQKNNENSYQSLQKIQTASSYPKFMNNFISPRYCNIIKPNVMKPNTPLSQSQDYLKPPNNNKTIVSLRYSNSGASDCSSNHNNKSYTQQRNFLMQDAKMSPNILKKCNSTQIKPIENSQTSTLSKFKLNHEKHKYLHQKQLRPPTQQEKKFENLLKKQSILKRIPIQDQQIKYADEDFPDIIIRVNSILVVQKEDDILKKSCENTLENEVLVESKILRRLQDSKSM